jgi:hypothetical protein
MIIVKDKDFEAIDMLFSGKYNYIGLGFSSFKKKKGNKFNLKLVRDLIILLNDKSIRDQTPYLLCLNKLQIDFNFIEGNTNKVNLYQNQLDFGKQEL